MKKNNLYILIIISLLYSCKADNKVYTFQINGNIKNFENEIILLQSGELATAKTILIAEKQHDSFIFKSKDSLPIGVYFIKIGNEPTRIPILIDNTDLNVLLNPLDLSKSYTQGNSELQKSYTKFQNGSRNTQNIFAYQKKFIEENKHSVLSAIVLNEMLGDTQWRLKQTLILYQELDSSVQYSKIGLEINNFITKGFEKIVGDQETDITTLDTLSNLEVKEQKTPTITASNKTKVINIPNEKKISYAPFFYGIGLDEREISAKDVFFKNKLTLLDFWASWCIPCRAQNPDLVTLYDKYHSKGFEILSIASDKDKIKWQNAIATDKMHWLHINDSYNNIANSYNVQAIPYAFLVNQKGEIVTDKTNISNLEKILKSQLGE